MNSQPARSLPLDFESAIATLLARRCPDGGLTEQSDGDYRPDATAWAVICLEAFHVHLEIVAHGRARLGANQLPNGSFPVASDYPEAFWPTAIAALALHGDLRFSPQHSRAIDFLLATSGRQLVREPGSPIGHDSWIPGWSWTDRTHSWIEPTAMAIKALTLAGKCGHQRVEDGIRLLLDRQLPTGGWNYGNTTVYGKTLNPMPVSTGMALWSLAGLVASEQISSSIGLLQKQLPRLRTPLSLGWALQGLAAWGADPQDPRALILDCLQRQNRLGPYGTSQLAILLLAVAGSSRPMTGHA